MNKGILSLGLICLIGVSLVGCSANSNNQTENNHEQATNYIDKTSTELLNQSKIEITYKSVSKTEPSMTFDIKTEPLTKENSDTAIEYRQNGRLLEATATNDKQVNTKNYHVTLENDKNPVTLSIYFDSDGQKRTIYERAYYPGSSKNLTF
ncbi:hypothetical protein R4Y45_04180 [Holzapfeliella sp. He02]|uniref:Lipoprotein n=1 Tax=Holzapfeliella saturejae TaxID=3082953 RepID=A0ABU8SGC0_9LACO